MPDLSQEQLDIIAQKIVTSISEKEHAFWVAPELHHKHHEWTAAKMLSEEEVKALRKKIIESAVIWAVPILVGFLLSIFWNGLVAFIKHGVK